MSMHTPRDESVDPQEWQLQEEALAQERAARTAGGGAGLQQYRLLHRALREAPAVALPMDFAAGLARRVERERLLDGRWEWRLLVFMLTLLAVAGSFQLYLHGGEWLAAWQRTLPSLSRGSGWLLVLGLALVWNHLSAVLGGGRHHAAPVK